MARIKEVMKCLLNGRFWFYSGKKRGKQCVGQGGGITSVPPSSHGSGA